MYIFWISAIIPFFKNQLPIKTTNNISIPCYLGLWEQMATSRSTKLLGTGIDYTNVTANYSIREDGNINVYNDGYNNNGEKTYINGYSYITGNDETKRKVHFDNVPTDGNYWIIKLGPIINKQYQYAIVCGPITSYIGTRFSLYVLARNRKLYKEKYETKVKKWCKDNGFNLYWNEYISTK